MVPVLKSAAGPPGRSRLLLFIILFFLITGSSGWGQNSPSPTPAPEGPQATQAPVILDGRILFYIKTGLLSFTAGDRARAAARLIRQAAENPQIGPRDIIVQDFEDRTEILAGKERLLTYTSQDAQEEGLDKSRAEIAGYYAQRIQKAIQNYREERSSRNILFGVLYTVLATLILVMVLFLAKFLFRKITGRIEAWTDTRIKGLQVQDLEVLSAERARDFLLGVCRWTQIVLTVAVFYVYLPLVLKFFPWTRVAAESVNSWSWNSLGVVGRAVWNYLPNLLIIALIVLIAYYVIKGFQFFFRAVERGRVKLPGVPSDLAMMTFKIVRFILIAFSVVVLYPYLPGSESAAFKGVSIFVGVLFSLGSSSVVANVFAGLSLTYMRAYRVGDRVKIGETVGDVIEMKLYGTRIRTIKNVEITLSNSQILQGPIVNYSAEARTRGLILHTSITIGYDTPWRTVHQLLIDAALKTRDILKQPPPFVLQTALNDFYITYELNAYTNQSNFMARIYSDLHENIQDTFNEAGTEIMSAHYMHIRDGNRTAIPDAYLPKDYEPRALRFYRNPTAGEESWRAGGKEAEK